MFFDYSVFWDWLRNPFFRCVCSSPRVCGFAPEKISFHKNGHFGRLADFSTSLSIESWSPESFHFKLSLPLIVLYLFIYLAVLGLSTGS